MGFSRQEYWSELLCLPAGDLPETGIKPVPPMALALQVDSLSLSHQRNPSCAHNNGNFLYFNLANLSETFYLVVPLTFLKCFLHFASKPLNHPVFSPASLPSISVFSSTSPSLSNLKSLYSQDSNLNWDLFSICMRSLGDLIWSCDFKYHSYTDDSHSSSLPIVYICTCNWGIYLNFNWYAKLTC